MTKFANRSKARPTKRMDLKKKYKIKGKVRQHNKKMRRQAKRMKIKGLKKKKDEMRQALPNMYPFKAQILNQYESLLPPKPEEPIVELSAEEFGLMVQSKQTVYMLRSKENAVKKYTTNLDKLLERINICLFTLEARNPQFSRNREIQQQIKKSGSTILYVITKSDSVQPQRLAQFQEQLKAEGVEYIRFTTENKTKSASLNSLIQKLNNIQLQDPIKKIGVIGKGCTGKFTLIKSLMRYLNIYKSINTSVLEVMIQKDLKFIDAPYKIHDETGYPLFNMPNDDEEFKIALEEDILKQLITATVKKASEKHYKCPILDRSQFLMNYAIQDFISIDDMLKKVGKTQRIFGKGGMVDTNKVRARILTDWLTGKINHLIRTK